MELVPAYAYEEEPILFLRKVNQRPSAPSGLVGTSPSTGNELSRKGYVYKFYSSEGTSTLYQNVIPEKYYRIRTKSAPTTEMLKFQAALTGEDVYQDL